jgi:phage gp36-like protein
VAKFTTPLATPAQFKRKIGPTAYDAILDDNEDGTGDDDVAAEFLADAQAMIEGCLNGNYTLPTDGNPRILTLLCLTLAQSFANTRYSEYVRAPGDVQMKWAEQQLDKLRKNETRLDDPDVDPANAGCDVAFGTSDDATGGVGGGVFEDGFGGF